MHLHGASSWLSAFGRLFVYWRSLELKCIQFEGIECMLCVIDNIKGIWVETYQFRCCWVHLCTFGLKRTLFKLLECNRTHLQVLKVNWLYEWCKGTFELKDAGCECIGSPKAHLRVDWLDVSVLKLQIWNWVEVSLFGIVGGWNGTYALKKSSFIKMYLAAWEILFLLMIRQVQSTLYKC